MKKSGNEKKGKSLILLVFAVLTFSVLIINTVFAADVAYIYNKKFLIDKNYVDFFENDLGLSVELISSTDVLLTDFSQYRFIFIGDERFSNPNELPIYDYPTVVVNFYHGPQFGLTDSDGISKLGRDAPMSVRITDTDEIVQVYTEGLYDMTRVAIPYYYLGNNDKVPVAESIVGTYSGNSYTLGDVISYIPAGTTLDNGKISQTNICFFGLVASSYWTDEAKQMFRDCVGYAGSICSYDSDCGENSESDLYCVGKDVYQDELTYSCENPRTIDSQCELNAEQHLVEECEDSCYEGQCVTIECRKDSDCGEDGFVDENFCDNNSVYQNFINYTCENPGTPESVCIEETNAVLKSNCGNDKSCSDGICHEKRHDIRLTDVLNYGKIKVEDSFGNNVTSLLCKQQYKITVNVENNGDYTENPAVNGNINGLNINFGNVNLTIGEKELISKTINISLAAGTYTINVNATIANDANPNDNKVSKQITVVCPQCQQRTDCPISYNSADYCKDNKVYKDVHDFPCNSGKCEESITKELVKECSSNQICSKGVCVNINCSRDSECDDGNAKTSDICVNPGTTASYCVNNPISCLNDNDCGIEGFSGNNFCKENSVYQNFVTYKCANAGSSNSFCTNSATPKLKQSCPGICANGQCLDVNCKSDIDCDDADVYTVDKCNNPNTLNSYCSHNRANCLNDNDCGLTGFSGNEFCTGNDVFKVYQTAVCKNAGTSSSYCDVKKSSKLVSDCGDSYCDSYGDGYCKNGDVYKSKTCYNKGCENGVCTSSSAVKEELIKKCANGCINGICGNIACGKDSDCEDENSHTQDICVNPGNVNSYCVHNPIGCNADSDCGTNGLQGLNYCKNSNVVGNFVTYKCINSGTTISYCSNSASPQLISNCGQSSCSEFGQYYCKGNEVYKSRTCENKGCKDGVCTNENKNDEQLVKKCPTGCSNGECKTFTITCSNARECDDSNEYTLDVCNNAGSASSYCSHNVFNCVTDNDCGTTGFMGNEFCSGNGVYKTYQQAVCVNAATTSSFCQVIRSTDLVVSCGSDSCKESENFCRDNAVYKTKTCTNRACSDGKCLVGNAVSQDILVKQCSENQKCNNGQCNNICIPKTCSQLGKQCGTWNDGCGGNVNCDGCPNGKKCNEDGQCVSTCTDECTAGQKRCSGNKVQTCGNYDSDSCTEWGGDVYCPEGCENGVCKTHVECCEDSDCGVNGWVDGVFCKNDDVYGKFKIYKCVNPGNSNSYCTNNVEDKFKLDCGDDYCGNYDGLYCKNGNVYKSRTCHDKGCSNIMTFAPADEYSKCFDNTNVDEKLVETCSNGCNNGQCNPVCVPKTCSQLGKECGTWSDGCGNNLNCGNCGAGQTCSNGRCNNICIPKTCSQLGKQCGTWNDGCGGTVCCDGCPNGKKCNNDGQCVQTCTDECTAGQKRCSGNSVQTCGNYDSDSCTEWGGDSYCQEGCENGVCKTHVECNCDSDCGINGFVDGVFCKNDDVYGKFKIYKCVNPGASNSYCNNNVEDKFKLDCGEDSCSAFDGNYCKNGNVYKSRTCHDKGCSNGQCFDNTNVDEKLVETCSNGCNNGQCNPVCVPKTCSQLGKECGTWSDGCGGTVCCDGCPNGKICSGEGHCIDIPVIICRKDSDCGENRFIDGKFCQNNDVFQNFLTYKCLNPGTTSSSCTATTNPVFKLDCGDSYCGNFDGLYCKNGNVYKSRTCHDKGCSNGQCFDNLRTDEQLVQTCSNGCNNGNCNPVCIPKTCSQLGKECGTWSDGCGNNLNCGGCDSNEKCSENGKCIPTTCEKTHLVPDTTFKGIKFQTVSNTVDANTLNILLVTAENLDGYSKTITYTNFMCRCQSHNGNPFVPAGACGDYWPFQIHSPGVTNCQTSVETLTLAPHEKKTISVSVSQYQNMFCGSFQLDVLITKINSDSFNPQLVGASFSDLCIDCRDVDVTCNNNADCLSDEYCKFENCGSAYGKCIKKPEMCTAVYQPVCGCDGKTYSNECVMASKGISMAHSGECISIITCTKDSDCGTDSFIDGKFCQNGNVYQNYLKFKCLNAGTSASSCSASASPVLKQVCAQECSNGECTTPTPTPSTNVLCKYSDGRNFDGTWHYNDDGTANDYSVVCRNGKLSSFCVSDFLPVMGANPGVYACGDTGSSGNTLCRYSDGSNFDGTWQYNREDGFQSFAVTCRNGVLKGFCTADNLGRGAHPGVYSCDSSTNVVCKNPNGNVFDGTWTYLADQWDLTPYDDGFSVICKTGLLNTWCLDEKRTIGSHAGSYSCS